MDWATITLAISTALSGAGAMFLWLETRGERGSKKRQARIDTQLNAVLSPIQAEIASLTIKFEAETSHTATIVRAAIAEALEPVKDQISTLNTKVEPMWRSLEQLAIDQARILHHPDPARAELDRLLDAFIIAQEAGTLLSADDDFALRHYLAMIRDWEPGKNIGFTVYPNEPTSAAILLRTMELNRIRKRQEHAR